MKTLQDKLKLPNVNEIAGFAPYRQYNSDPNINAYFLFLKKRLHDLIQDRLNLLRQISYSYNESENTYIQFYYENLFGFLRTFGETRVKNQYDTGIKYDTGLIYDDANFDGFLDLSCYKILIKYLLDYGEESYTLGWLYGLVIEFCKFQPSQVQITETYASTSINCPRTRESVLLQQIFNDKQTYLNFPIEGGGLILI